MNTAERQRDGSINEQSVWRYVKECNTADPSRVCRTAVIDCTREYTYGQMLTEWEHYARVFSALGITHENKSRVGIVVSGFSAFRPMEDHDKDGKADRYFRQ